MGILRLILALSVVVAHSGPILGFGFVGGEMAVKTFFIISGFYMSLILNEKYVGKNNSYKLFISNRLLRLYPVYWAVLFLTIFLCIGIGVRNGNMDFPVLSQYSGIQGSFFSIFYLIASNLFIFGQDLVMFMGIDPLTGHFFFTSNFANTHPQLFRFLFIPQAWTLGLELMFYLMAPFILKRGIKPVIILTVLSFAVRLFIHYGLSYQNDPWTYRFFPGELMFFMFGYFSYRLYLKIKIRNINKAIIISLFVYFIALSITYSGIPTFGYPVLLKEILYYTSAVVLLPFIFNFFKKFKCDTFIGELSYPVYISHVLVIMFCDLFLSDFYKQGIFIALYTIAFSLLLNQFIANPVENYRQSRIR